MASRDSSMRRCAWSSSPRWTARIALAEARMDRRAADSACSRAPIVRSNLRWNCADNEERFMLTHDCSTGAGTGRAGLTGEPPGPQRLHIELVRAADHDVDVLVDDLDASLPQELLVVELGAGGHSVAVPVAVRVPVDV